MTENFLKGIVAMKYFISLLVLLETSSSRKCLTDVFLLPYSLKEKKHESTRKENYTAQDSQTYFQSVNKHFQDRGIKYSRKNDEKTLK